MPLFLLPLAAALALLAISTAPGLAMLVMGLVGLTAGSSNTLVTVALTELYGPASLAVVRALAASAMILAPAQSPALVGIALDTGVGMSTVLVACLALSLAAGPLAAQGMANASRQPLISA